MQNPLPVDAIIPELGVSLQDLETYVAHVREGQYLLMAGITLIVYDYFCTLEEEVSFVWGQAPRLVAAKILFALNRYLPIFTLIFRFIVFNKALYNAAIHVAIVEVVLLLRVWVLYSRKRWIGIALWSFYVVCLALALAIKYLQPHTNLPFVPAPTYGGTGCSKVASGEMFFIYGVVTIAESVFFIMLLGKAYHTTRNSSHTPILIALLKQGTLYYFIVLAILTVTMFAPFSDGLYWPIANAFPIVPIVSIACNRLILSLRGMVFSNNVVSRSSGWGRTGSGSGSHERAASGNLGMGGKGIAGGMRHSRSVSRGNGAGVQGGHHGQGRLQVQRSSTIVTFTDDWREEPRQQEHQLDNGLVLDVIPDEEHGRGEYEMQRRRRAGDVEDPWEGGNRVSLHPMMSY